MRIRPTTFKESSTEPIFSGKSRRSMKRLRRTGPHRTRTCRLQTECRTQDPRPWEHRKHRLSPRNKEKRFAPCLIQARIGVWLYSNVTSISVPVLSFRLEKNRHRHLAEQRRSERLWNRRIRRDKDARLHPKSAKPHRRANHDYPFRRQGHRNLLRQTSAAELHPALGQTLSAQRRRHLFPSRQRRLRQGSFGLRDPFNR